MKQYLHTIMRSLCIMVMLCGISTSAWADFSEGEGTQESPWIITQDTWDEFASSYGSTTEYHFQLGGDIVLTSAPISSLDITSTYLDVNSCTITVGSDSYDLSFPDTFFPVFSSESDLEDNVTYYFGVSSYSDLQNISSNHDAISDKPNINISVPSSFVIDSAPTETLTMPSYFSINDGDITVGDESTPVSFDSSFTPLFSDDSNVKYYFKAESDTWNDFVSYYNDLSSPSNVYLVMTEDVELTSSSDPLNIDSEYFINANDNKIRFSDGTDPFNVFSDSEMNTAYVEGGGYEITDNDSWKEFVAAYNNGAVTDDTPVTINGDITIDSTDDLPTSSISINNISYDSFTITVGSSSYDFSLPEKFKPIFEDSSLENNVTYYFSICSDDELGYFVNQHDALSKDNVNIMLTSSVNAPDGFTQITEFNGHFDGGDNYITMPNCNINDYKPLFEDGLTNVTVKYSCNNITIDDVDGLNELSNNVSDWDDICVNYTIDLTKGDIRPESSWTPIDDTERSFDVTYLNDTETPHYIVFTTTSCVAEAMDSDPVYLKKSDYEIDVANWRYSDLLIEDDACINALLGNSNLTAATLKLTLGYNIDLQDFTDASPSLPLSFSGDFDQNNHSVTLPPLTVSSTDIPRLFDDDYTGTPVEYTSGGLLITSADDFVTFANNQAHWLPICKDIILGKEGETTDIELTEFLPTISKEFNITNNTSSFTVGNSGSLVDIAGYKPVFEDGDLVDYYYLEITSPAGFAKLTNYSFDTSDYILLNHANSPFDLTDITFGENLSNNVDVNDNVTIYLPDNCNGVLPFSQSGSGEITQYNTPSCYLVDNLYQGALLDSEKRSVDSEGNLVYDDQTFADMVKDDAGSGTQSSPYLIYTYDMLEKLVEIVNDKGADYTSGMYIKLMSDINAQGNERLTDENGNASNTTATIQFTKAFKGYFDGNKYSIGGLTQPLFSSLDGAEIKNLGIVDCYMTTPALVAGTATGSTITMSYVSGVSNGLIPASGVTATNCYAFNPQTYTNRTNKTEKLATTEAEGYKAYNITEGTEYGQVTLADDLSGTHKVIKGNSYAIAGGYSDCTLFIPENNTFYTYTPSSTLDMSTYISYINWADNFDWIESPYKSNVALLHNVLYNNFWNKNTCNSYFGGYGGAENLSHLYSWYIVDKKAFTVPSDPFRVKNIYYSRQNTTTGAAAPDGLNTIYLPFAWNPATDLYYTNSSGEEEQITTANVYILADKLNSDQFSDDDDVLYKDYSVEKSLLFFDPVDGQATENSERYNDFANISNALPTILNIPEGKSGWYIKRTDLANYGIKITDNKTETINGENVTYPNLYDRYWEDPDAINISDYSEDAVKKGRSFMEIDRLGGSEWSESSNQSEYTYSYYHSIDKVSGCDKQEPVTVMNRDEKEVYDYGNSIIVTIYKAPESNAIAVDGGNYQIKIKSYDEDNNETILYETDGDDRIVIDSDGKPAILYAYDENEKVVINNDGTINVYKSDGNGGYTSSGDLIYVDFEYDSRYPLSSGFYVCGGHEDGVWADQSGVYDFPGRAYHLGTFTTIAKETFKDGKLVSDANYSCYKLNSAGDGFAAVTSNSSVQPFRTFFAIAKGVGDIDTGTPNLAKTAYKLGFCGIYDGSKDDQTTKIDGVPTKGIHLMTTDESKVYSIDGRYVGQYGKKKLAPGMYIMNGKKFVVK